MFFLHLPAGQAGGYGGAEEGVDAQVGAEQAGQGDGKCQQPKPSAGCFLGIESYPVDDEGGAQHHVIFVGPRHDDEGEEDSGQRAYRASAELYAGQEEKPVADDVAAEAKGDLADWPVA